MGSDESPLRSALDDDPAHAEAIDAFVVSLAERVDALQDLESRGELPRLADAARELGATARALGYPLFANAADDVAAAAREPNAELVYKALLELTALSWRVRRGHRGAL